jgi:6-phosphogluconolactonase
MPPETQAPLALEVHADARAVAHAAAERIATALAAAVAARGRATLAVSGGRTPLAAFARLADAALPWERIGVLQVDERCAPEGHEDRNAVQLERAFGRLVREHRDSFHWIPFAADHAHAAREYAAILASVAGTPPVIDVVQLGLGADGHTASLFPGGRLELPSPSVGYAPSAPLWPRITLTLPVLNAARGIVWLVTGRDKRAALHDLLRGAPELVASGVRTSDAIVLADRVAAE